MESNGIRKFQELRENMAKRRMISRKLGGSKKLLNLVNTKDGLAYFASTIYVLGIAWHDDYGQISADPHDWKYRVFPTSPEPVHLFAKALKLLEEAKLLMLSECEQAYLYINYQNHQTLKNDRTAQNDFPGFHWNPLESIGALSKDKLSKDKLKEKNIQIPLRTSGKFFTPTETNIKNWVNTFPEIDVISSLKIIRQWNIDNPSRRKTLRGVTGHIFKWLMNGNKEASNSKIKNLAEEERFEIDYRNCVDTLAAYANDDKIDKEKHAKLSARLAEIKTLADLNKWDNDFGDLILAKMDAKNKVY